LYVISDEIYEYLNYADKDVSIGALPGMKERTITINGFSKAYAMTGLRIGYGAGPRAIIALAENLQSQTTSGPSSIVQYMALEALHTPKEKMRELAMLFHAKRDLAVRLATDAGLDVVTPTGAFYLFPKIPGNSQEFAQKLLEQEKVAVVPGSAFGMESHVRISYATSEENIREGMARIKRFLESQ
jgi:aspartate/methionine/tyrosine aminotransferase